MVHDYSWGYQRPGFRLGNGMDLWSSPSPSPSAPAVLLESCKAPGWHPRGLDAARPTICSSNRENFALADPATRSIFAKPSCTWLRAHQMAQEKVHAHTSANRTSVSLCAGVSTVCAFGPCIRTRVLYTALSHVISQILLPSHAVDGVARGDVFSPPRFDVCQLSLRVCCCVLQRPKTAPMSTGRDGSHC